MESYEHPEGHTSSAGSLKAGVGSRPTLALCTPARRRLYLVLPADEALFLLLLPCHLTIGARDGSPFMSAPLDMGTLRDGTIVCPQSGSAFDLETGTALRR
jgi:nitrite reductase/ring-hydroxylating ferredoxin subunit